MISVSQNCFTKCINVENVDNIVENPVTKQGGIALLCMTLWKTWIKG